jgi:8-oxo-dGTP pyrophosphatase MutT (NUDIX family)
LTAAFLTDPNSSTLRAELRRKLRPSLSLADLEHALSSEMSGDASGGRAPEQTQVMPWRPAAVLIPIIERPDGLAVLLTLRATGLRAHSGQVAFPGGKIDAGEAPRDAALRETYEEIGLGAPFIETLGWLDVIFTGTGFRVAPLVALVDPLFALSVNKLEVDEVFEVPFAFLMDAANYRLEEREWQAQRRTYYAISHGRRYIWGATASILRNLYEKLYG